MKESSSGKQYFMKQCVIFDMDGVIIDSEPIHLACERRMFKMLEINVSDEQHNALVGTTDDSMWKQLGQLHDLPIQRSEIVELKKSLYMEYLKKEIHIKPIPYIAELIATLSRNGFQLVLASSSPHEQINHILNLFGISHYFHATISGEDVEAGKPHPGIFLKAAETIGVATSSCVVIEDSFNGVTAAKSAHMKCIGFANPNSGNQDLSKADIIVHSIKEVSVTSINELLKSPI